MRENLVVVRAGRGSLHPAWVAGDGPRAFDLWTCPYEPCPPSPDAGPAVPPVAGPKWSGLSRFLASERGWRDYERVWLPDDDLATDAATASRFFEVCRARDAALAAPALARGSQYSHVLSLENRSFSARETTFVEIMAPCFRRDVLEALLPTLGASATGHGWGLDDAWGRLLGYRGLLVVDETPVRHDRRVGSGRTRETRVALRREMRDVRRRHDACSMRKTVGGTLRDGTSLTEAEPAFLATYLRGYAWLTDDDPAVERRLRRDQANDPDAWVAGAARRARRGRARRLWERLRALPGPTYS